MPHINTPNLVEYPLYINILSAQIHETNVKKGFWPKNVNDRNFGEAVALMHTELTEALIAYSTNAMDDKITTLPGYYVELADCAIRILDYLGAFNQNVSALMNSEEIDILPLSCFGKMEGLLRIHTYLSYALEADRKKVKMLCGTDKKFAYLSYALSELFKICDHYEFDLMDAIRLKLDYNETRPYKHGKVY